jgi:hypothetical protein
MNIAALVFMCCTARASAEPDTYTMHSFRSAQIGARICLPKDLGELCEPNQLYGRSIRYNHIFRRRMIYVMCAGPGIEILGEFSQIPHPNLRTE